LDRERWQRISDTFDAALDKPVEERGSYIDFTCDGDQSLASEVRRLLSEYENASNFMESPVITGAPSLPIGELVAQRYRIESLLGEGGMGAVYLATDEFMHERIALKTLRREFSGNDELIRRFHKEVQLARKVTHINVCRVFEVGVHKAGNRSVHFFTMQLLQGETLAARIRRAGPVPPDEAVQLAVQMADGLEAAHLAGIIHCDFKSSNVMLSQGKAIITDFGLAGLEPGYNTSESPASASLRTGSQLAGTIAYMSPEQLSEGTVTAASDIYSFGIVLYEMVTASLPFDDRLLIRSAMQRASDFVPDVRALAPNLNRSWSVAIAKCLQRDPAKRYSQARDVAIQLQSPSGTLPAHWNRPAWTRRQWAAGMAVGISAPGLALIAHITRFHWQSSKLPEGAMALVSPIENLTGDKRFDGITELFRGQLSQSVHLNLLADGRLSEVLKQMGRPEGNTEPAALREAAWRSNAPVWVTGTVSRIVADYVLNVQVEVRGSQPDNPRSKALRSFSASDAAALMRSTREASLWVREIVGESAATISSFDRLPEEATTPSWEALDAYARGQQFFLNQNFDPAILEFESALRADPMFTLAALRRADLLVSQGRQKEGFAQWRSAITMLAKRRITRAEELNARGMFALDSGDIPEADRYYRIWSQEYPFDWRAPFYRTLPLMLDGHVAEALDLLQRVRQQMPDYGDVYAQLIACHLVLGQPAEAEALVPELRKRGRPERADLRLGYIRFIQGDCVGYLRILRQVQVSTAYHRGAADAMLREGLLLVDAGYPEAAADNIEAFLRRGSWVETEAQQTGLRMVQAWGELIAGRKAAAIAHAKSALDSETGPIMVAVAGSIFARAGAASLVHRALSLCEGLMDIPLYQIARHRILGEQARAAGRTARSIEEFRNAAALEPYIAHRQYLIEALPSSDPECMALCQNVIRIPWQLLRPPPLHCLGSLSIAIPLINNTAGAGNAFSTNFAASCKKLANLL
jgi:eukaryotic-like serine/threonine-protein kinase